MTVGIVVMPYIAIPANRYGGTERIITYLIKGLKELGHEVILFAAGDSTLDCTIIPTFERSIFGMIEEDPSLDLKDLEQQAYRKSVELIKENLHRIDVIHAHEFDLLEFQDFPSLYTIHNGIELNKIAYFEERKDIHYVSISENQQHSFPDLNYAGTVYNGLDPDEFPYVSKPEDYLCFLGRFDREKNPHEAIHLAIKLGMKLKLGGKASIKGREYFEKECKPYFDHPLIEYLGELDMKQKADLISHAKCNLHPTNFREPFGLSVLEAAHCGTPTLAISRGSMPELIEEGRTGILVEDYIEAYHHIEECFKLDREYISQRARMLFNYDKMARGYVDIYQKIIQEYKGKA